MASSLSQSAIRQILSFDSLERAFVIKRQVDAEDVRAIFAHGKPLKFWSCPRLVVSKIVEAFRELQNEPEFLDLTIASGSGRPSEVWLQVYTTHLPCRACTTVESVQIRNTAGRTNGRGPGDPFRMLDFVVEKFHVSSKSFGKQLTVELHYQLGEGEEDETEQEPSSDISKIVIRLVNGTCHAREGLSVTANRSSATLLLLPDFASEVFGFLDRAHVGSSLLANRDLQDIICQLKHRLPVHHLRCRFERELLGSEWVQRPSGAYWMQVRHVQRDLSYNDVRRFKVPSTSGAERDSALIRHYLSNSHVAELLPPKAKNVSFAIKMLADLANRNFSVRRMQLRAGSQRLSDYRSMDVVFGELRIDSLQLSCDEHRFAELVKTTDLFRMATVQRLWRLKLSLNERWNEEHGPKRQYKRTSPLWVSGINLLPNCDYYRVDYTGTDRHQRLIERKIVQICEAFERGETTDIVKHFEFTSKKEMNYAFSRDNLLVSGMIVEGKYPSSRINDFEWDVYRFRNAITSEYLTACIGRYAPAFSNSRSFLHISKGEVYPDASFVSY